MRPWSIVANQNYQTNQNHTNNKTKTSPQRAVVDRTAPFGSKPMAAHGGQVGMRARSMKDEMPNWTLQTQTQTQTRMGPCQGTVKTQFHRVLFLRSFAPESEGCKLKPLYTSPESKHSSFSPSLILPLSLLPSPLIIIVISHIRHHSLCLCSATTTRLDLRTAEEKDKQRIPQRSPALKKQRSRNGVE